MSCEYKKLAKHLKSSTLSKTTHKFTKFIIGQIQLESNNYVLLIIIDLKKTQTVLMKWKLINLNIGPTDAVCLKYNIKLKLIIHGHSYRNSNPGVF